MTIESLIKEYKLFIHVYYERGIWSYNIEILPNEEDIKFATDENNSCQDKDLWLDSDVQRLEGEFKSYEEAKEDGIRFCKEYIRDMQLVKLSETKDEFMVDDSGKFLNKKEYEMTKKENDKFTGFNKEFLDSLDGTI